MYYVNWARMFINVIIPLLCLLYCNAMVYKRIKVPLKESDQPSGLMERDLARVLIVIVVVFVLCNIMRLLLNFHEAINITHMLACRDAGHMHISLIFSVAVTFNELLLTINSSVNMIIYCCLNSKFRSVMFCQTNDSRMIENDVEDNNKASQMIELKKHVEVN